jgi:hypothetical protein
MKEILKLKSAFEEIKNSSSNYVKFLSNVELSFCTFAVNFKSSFSELKLHKCKSMYKFNHDVFSAVFDVFEFGLKVFSFFTNKTQFENPSLEANLQQMQNALLKFLEAFLHKTGKRVDIIINNTRGLRDYLRQTRNIRSIERTEFMILEKNLLLMAIDLHFFENFVHLIKNHNKDLFEGFKEKLVESFKSILQIVNKEKLKIPKQLFDILKHFFRIYCVLVEFEWDRFVSIFNEFVDLIIYFENKNEIHTNFDPFLQIKEKIDLNDIIFKGESEKLIKGRYNENSELIHFKSRPFKRFFQNTFLNNNSKIIFSILKESYKFKQKFENQINSNLEKYTNSFFKLLEHYIFKFLDDKVLIQLNKLMVFLKFLCDQNKDLSFHIPKPPFLISKKNNSQVSKFLSNVCDSSSQKNEKNRKISEKYNLEDNSKIEIRKRNKTDIKLLPSLNEQLPSIEYSNNESDSMLQSRILL